MSNTTNTTPESERPSPTVESLMDEEKSICSIDSFKGRATFAINKNSPYPFSFGTLKAKLIVKHLLGLLVFVATDGKSVKAPKELEEAWNQFLKVYKACKL
jgi:hypothetical protein